MSQVARSASAREDLKEIGRYITQQSESLCLALRFLARIDEQCNLYATHPEMGTSRIVLGPKVRCFPVRDYFHVWRRNGITRSGCEKMGRTPSRGVIFRSFRHWRGACPSSFTASQRGRDDPADLAALI